MTMGQPLEPETFTGSTGAIVIDSPAPAVVLVRFSGHVGRELVPPAVASMTRRHTGEGQHYFFDAWDLVGYDSALRTEMTAWFLRRRSSVASLHTVARSKIVSMGIAVANVALGFMTNHPDRTRFDAALAEQVGARKTG